MSKLLLLLHLIILTHYVSTASQSSPHSSSCPSRPAMPSSKSAACETDSQISAAIIEVDTICHYPFLVLLFHPLLPFCHLPTFHPRRLWYCYSKSRNNDNAQYKTLIRYTLHSAAKHTCLDADRGEKESGTGRPKTFKWS